MDEIIRPCSRCGEVSVGYKLCQQCRNRTKDQYYKFRDDRISRVQRYLQRLKAEVYEHYGNRCACCGEAQVLFLQLDHVNNDGAKERKRLHPKGHVASQSVYRDAKRQGFPATLQLLCANCNYGKRMNNGVCPHKPA